jgi:histidinol-phosphatase (PHP family)
MTSAAHDAQHVDDRLAHDVPLDSHVHTELSHDSDVPLHLYAAAARARNISEIAVTDHLDFDRRDPNFKLDEYERRRRLVREAADLWEGRPHLRFGAEITFERRLEPQIRDYLATHPYDYVIGSVHISERTPLKDAHEAARWCAGKTPAEAAGWYFDEVLGAIRSGLFDTIGHLDFVKRWLVPFVSVGYATVPELYEPLLRALVESGTALEINSSGLRQPANELYPSPGAVDRFRALGGRYVTAGSDSHRIETFGFALGDAYALLERAGFEDLAFRRGGERVTVPIGSRP